MLNRPRRLVLVASIISIVQVLCGLVFIAELFSDVFGLRSWALDWQAREVVQLTAVFGLILGGIASLLFLRANLRHAQNVERQLQAASGAFHLAINAQFANWGLSRSESDVALYAIKGFNNPQIADLRGTSEATVKTQINAIFRKSGVQSRSELMAHFMDLLVDQPSRYCQSNQPEISLPAPSSVGKTQNTAL
ncbi:MAG: helix-turn-helix transcriptional regulator [Rhodobacteraceae bacterium]|nr:helix-turn-helix transcriptional regulator [Paracoccaceae bacterium]